MPLQAYQLGMPHSEPPMQVLPSPPPGVYGFYADQRSRLSAAALRQLRAELPALERCMAERCSCPRRHTLQARSSRLLTCCRLLAWGREVVLHGIALEVVPCGRQLIALQARSHTYTGQPSSLQNPALPSSPAGDGGGQWRTARPADQGQAAAVVRR